MSVTESPLSKWGPIVADCDGEEAILRRLRFGSVVELFLCCRDGLSLEIGVCVGESAGVPLPPLSLRVNLRPGGISARQSAPKNLMRQLECGGVLRLYFYP